MAVGESLQLPDGRVVKRTERTAAFHHAEQYNDIELIYYVNYPGGRKEDWCTHSDAVFLPL